MWDGQYEDHEFKRSADEKRTKVRQADKIHNRLHANRWRYGMLGT